MLTQPNINAAEFNKAAEELYTMTHHIGLRRELDRRFRRPQKMHNQLILCRSVVKLETYHVKPLVDIIRSGGTIHDVDPKVLRSIEIFDKVTEVWRLYAEALGLEIQEVDGSLRVNWQKAGEVETITRDAG